MAHARRGSLAVGYVAEGGQVAYYAAPRPSVSWPHQIGVLPRQADCFQDRSAVAQLEQVMASGGTAVLCQVLSGMGGVGKTQLAAHHARFRWQSGNLDLLLWITAATRTAILSAYTQAAAEILGADPTDPERAARSFLAWLEPNPDRPGRRWMIVLDDLADPADLRGLWPPASPLGRTLISTRRRDAALTGPGRHLVSVGLFTPDESAAYLTTTLAAHEREEPADLLAALAADLGHLPLALSQAAAYLIDADLDCAAYRTLLADRARTLTDPSALPDDQLESVAAAWSLSIDRVDRLPPAGLARPLLQLAAVLDPNGIPAPVLYNSPALEYLTEHRAHAIGQAQPDQVTTEDAARVLRTLHRLSLIDHTPRSPHHAVRVHQLIQRTARDALGAQHHHRLAQAAADALIAAWPDIERDTALAQALRANADALARYAEDALYQDSGVHPLLFRAGVSLGDTGQAEAAAHHFQRMVEMTQDRLGREHPDCLDSRENLAYWRGETGDEAGAAIAYRELLTDRERLLGPDHPETLSARVGVLFYPGRAGDWSDALSAARQQLADHERILGLDHPATLNVRNVIANFQGNAGDAAGAAAAFEPLLQDFQRVVGTDDSYTLSIQRQLFFWRGMAGDPADAASAFEPLLHTMRRTLGADHSQVRMTLNHLAYFRGKAGDEAGAATAYQELAADCERVLGPEHPDTLAAKSGFAAWQRRTGESTVHQSTD
ncbi:tetratricopeptide repeat protein [Streptomyces herbicida]|uniref:tetratricopeptide repeat protein n=1 Tax=Streptomyces herbicida TaxID=3065675 RepID=UPI00293144BF|nr:tetratricopeptide repeat protein [Streptomyces sp. NEAU-HV9]